MKRFTCPVLTMTIVAISACGLEAAPPWEMFLPFKHVEANPQKSYAINRENGPWLLYAASFAGPTAERQAHDLVLELRSKHKVEAFLYKQEFDYTKTEIGKGYDKYGKPKRMKPRIGARYDAYAVLVGEFPTVDDPACQKLLDKIQHLRPKCLQIEEGKWSNQRYAGLRHIQRMVIGDEEKRKKGPMGNAFVTRNPLLPDEYFVGGGLDDTIVQMNEDVEHSLLKCKGKYSVRVASFSGASTMKIAEIERLQNRQSNTGQLEEAAMKAHKLTLALRKKGIEAYEFHDRFESIVTVGSFDSVGRPLPDGNIEINSAIHRVMNSYGAQRQQLGGASVGAGLTPKKLNGISFDIQPMPIETPRASVGARYARRGLPRF